jgi:hypothetical protein
LNALDRAGAKPYEGRFAGSCLRAWARGARREPIETLGRRPSAEPLRQGRRGCGKSVREEAGRNLRQGFRERALEGGNPREHPAVGVLITRVAARGSRKGESPGAAARSARPADASRRAELREKRQVGASAW